MRRQPRMPPEDDGSFGPDVLDWLTDLLLVGATEDAARRSRRYRQRLERIIVVICAIAVVLVIVAALMLLLGR